MRYEIRELGLGGVLDQAVALLKNHFGLLFGISLCLMIPLNLIHSFGVHTVVPQVAANPTHEQLAAYGQAMKEALPLLVGLNVGFVVLALLIVTPVTNGATIHAVAQKYLDKAASVGGALKFALRRLPGLLWTSLLAYLAIVISCIPGLAIGFFAMRAGVVAYLIGLVIAAVPAIILMFRYFLATYVVVIEGTSGGAALKRSGQLMKGNAGKAFVLSFLLGVIGVLVGVGARFIPVPEAGIVVMVLVNGVLFALGAAAWTVLYFSARCRLEGFDLTLLAESLGRGRESDEEAGPLERRR
jgi:hypothetical protein